MRRWRSEQGCRRESRPDSMQDSLFRFHAGGARRLRGCLFAQLDGLLARQAIEALDDVEEKRQLVIRVALEQRTGGLRDPLEEIGHSRALLAVLERLDDDAPAIVGQ